MPEIKLDPTITRQQLRKTPSVTKAARALNVHPSTISRFVARDGIDLHMITTANNVGFRRVAKCLKDIGLTNTHIAQRLAVSPGYITQTLTQSKPTHA